MPPRGQTYRVRKEMKRTVLLREVRPESKFRFLFLSRRRCYRDYC